jgi:hypothetical protein
MDERISQIPRFKHLKKFKNGLENISRFTADDYRNLMKIMVFVIEDILKNKSDRINKLLVNLYLSWNNMYLMSRKNQFSENELVDFQVYFSLIMVLFFKSCIIHKLIIDLSNRIRQKVGQKILSSFLNPFLHLAYHYLSYIHGCTTHLLPLNILVHSMVKQLKHMNHFTNPQLKFLIDPQIKEIPLIKC